MMLKKLWAILLILVMSVGVHIAPVNAEEISQTPFSVLLLGIDTGDLGRTDKGRSDVVMVMTVNPTTERMTLTSIPRDTYTEIIGKGFKDKINHAYAFGGVEMSKATVENLVGSPIEHYIAVNMAGLKDIVDAVGGVEVVPPTSFEIEGVTFEGGVPTHLDGEKALAYARERYTSGGDYARQGRQREIIEAVLNKANPQESLANFQKLFTAMAKNIETDLDFTEWMALYNHYKAMGPTLEMYQLQGEGQMIDGVYYDVSDESSLAQLQERLLNK